MTMKAVPVAGRAGVVGGDNVRVRQAGRRDRLAPEPFEEALVAGQVADGAS